VGSSLTATNWNANWSLLNTDVILTGFFLQAVSCTFGFIHVIKKKWPRDDEFIMVWWVWLSAVGEVVSQFVCKVNLLSFALSNKMQSKICCREELNRWRIHRMDKICLQLGSFEEFTNAVLQTLAICAKECLSTCDYFFWIAWMRPTVCETAWNKSHFKGRLGSN